MKYPNLFTSMNIGSVPIKNRAVMTAMCVGLANHDGSVSEPLAAYYEERAKMCIRDRADTSDSNPAAETHKERFAAGFD